MTFNFGRYFRIGQQITQIIPAGYEDRIVHRVVVGVHPDRVDVVTHGEIGEGHRSFTVAAPNYRLDVAELLPPNVGMVDRDRRPWPRTTRAFRYAVTMILESQVIDGAWATSNESDNQPPHAVHVFVPKWAAPLAHVRDLLECYLPYPADKLEIVGTLNGDISRMITITRPEEAAT